MSPRRAEAGGARADPRGGARLWVRDVEVGEGYAAAVAVGAAVHKFRLWAWVSGKGNSAPAVGLLDSPGAVG